MSYHYSKIVTIPFDQAIASVTESLKEHGFGVLTDIDVRAILNKKLELDFRPYRILGACNPNMAYKALQIENKIGTILPCNVIVQQHNDGQVEVSAVDPLASMQAVENPRLLEVAEQVRGLLRQAIDRMAQ